MYFLKSGGVGKMRISKLVQAFQCLVPSCASRCIKNQEVLSFKPRETRKTGETENFCNKCLHGQLVKCTWTVGKMRISNLVQAFSVRSRLAHLAVLKTKKFSLLNLGRRARRGRRRTSVTSVYMDSW